MKTKAITISFDPKNSKAYDVQVNKRFLKSTPKAKTKVIEQTMAWLQAAYVTMANNMLNALETAQKEAQPSKRRGRPPKNDAVAQPIKRKRGRPKKNAVVVAPMQRRRGRPKKVEQAQQTVVRRRGRPKATPMMTPDDVMALAKNFELTGSPKGATVNGNA